MAAFGKDAEAFDEEIRNSGVEQEEVGGFQVCSGVSCTKAGLIGDFNWKWLCTPVINPWGQGKLQPPPFLGKDDRLPLLVSVLMGLQHCLAMLGGIITVPSLIASDACFPWQFDAEMCGSKQYLISASLIVSGLLTIIQVVRFKVRTGLYIGTGLVSVMGTSFTFLPIARDVITTEIRAGRSGFEAYGAFLGTCMVAALVEIAISFMPARFMRRAFPPVVTGTCVILIGAGLTATGIKYWGGGVFCAENSLSRLAAFGSPQLCTGNGEVVLGYGAPEYFGLGASVLLMLVLLQIFGSPFMKNCSVIIALFFGYIVAAASSYTTPDGQVLSYVDSSKIDDAPWFNFPWMTTFPLGFYPPAFIPIIVGFLVSSIETMGDISASCEASHIPGSGPDAESRIQGGLLADGLNSVVATLMTTAPNTTFSQNNGVIALTRCASRAAGLACAGWLIVLGMFSKFAGVISSIPDAVLGGMTIFLFANVFISGIAILADAGVTKRRNRFILAMALGLGLGVTAVPDFANGGGVTGFAGGNLNHNIGLIPARDICAVFPKKEVTFKESECKFRSADSNRFVYINGWEEKTCDHVGGDYSPSKSRMEFDVDCVNNNGFCCIAYDDTTKMWRDTVIIILRTPYCIGTLIAILLHAILPEEEEDDEADDSAMGGMNGKEMSAAKM